MHFPHDRRPQALGGGGDRRGEKAGEEEDGGGQEEDQARFPQCQPGLELRQDRGHCSGQPGSWAGDGGAGCGEKAEGRDGVLPGYPQGGEGVCQNEEVLGMMID